MHELGIAQSIISILRDESTSRGLHPRCVSLRIGELSDVVPDSLNFALQVLIRDTKFGQVEFTQRVIPVRLRCRSCQIEYQASPRDLSCPGCHECKVDLLSGQELEIDSIEFWSQDEFPYGRSNRVREP